MVGRRGHGEGSIYQRESDGKWCAVVDLGWVRGKRKRKVIYGRTRKEVAEKLKVILRDQQQGLPVATERQAVGQFLDRWLNEVMKHTLEDSTFETYGRRIRLHIVPHIGRVALRTLGAQDLARLYSILLDQDLSPSTVRYDHAILHKALDQALRWNLIARNPADLVDAPRPDEQEMRPLSEEESERLLQAAEGSRLHALYALSTSR